jgi:hypothetical protein
VVFDEKELKAETIAGLLGRAGWLLGVRQLPGAGGTVWLIVLRKRNTPVRCKNGLVVWASGPDEAFRRAYRAAMGDGIAAEEPLPVGA